MYWKPVPGHVFIFVFLSNRNGIKLKSKKTSLDFQMCTFKKD